MTCFYKHTVLTGLQAENKSPPMDNFPLPYARNYGRILEDFWIAVSRKVTQALANPFELDAYVVVCAFSPFAHLIRFSYHRWEK